MGADPDPPVEPGTTGRDAAPTGPDRSFTTHPTGTALAKDLREVRSKPERAFNIGAALGLTLAVATFIFLIQNNRPTDFEWLWFDFELPLWSALVGALVIGAVLVLTALAVHHRRRRRIGRRDRAAGRLEEALVGEPGDPGGPERPGGGRTVGDAAAPAAGPAEPGPAAPEPAAHEPVAPGPAAHEPVAPGPDPGASRPGRRRSGRSPMQG
jgi:uncharacterized integral membrane protein